MHVGYQQPLPSASKTSLGLLPKKGKGISVRLLSLGAHRRGREGVRLCVGLFLFSSGVSCGGMRKWVRLDISAWRDNRESPQ